MMEKNLAENLYPEGDDRLTVLDGKLVMVTTLRHSRDRMIVRVLENQQVLSIPYPAVRWSIPR